MSANSVVEQLNPNDFTYSGFGNLLPRLEARIKSLGTASGNPEICTEEMCLYIPATREPNHSPARSGIGPKFSGYRGGFVSNDGTPLDWSQLRRGGKAIIASLPNDPRVTNPDSWDEDDREVIYLGWLFNHFGHFLVESLARVWAVSELASDLPIVYHSLGHNLSSAFITGVLKQFGIPEDRVLLPRRPTRFRKVFIPDSMHELHFRAHISTANPYRCVAENIVGGDGTGASDQPVYISRRLLANDKRALIGEWELEESLQENGFIIVRPETMTFNDQVRLFNRHRNIFAVEQSALNSVLFALRPSNIHCISTWGIPLGDFFLLPKVSGAKASYLNASFDYRNNQPTSRQSVHILNLEGIFEYLHDQGFMPHNARSMLARRVPDLFAQYEEAMFHSRITSARKNRADLTSTPDLESAAENLNSWVVSAALSSYYATSDYKKCEYFARLFVQYLERETDLSLLAKYQNNVTDAALTMIRACSPDTATLIKSVTFRKLAIEL